MGGKPQDGSSSSTDGGNPSNLQVIVKLETNDVMMGRGSCASRNVGNVRFRELIAKRKQEYLRAGRNCTKQMIAMEIVAEITRRKGRFVRQAKPEESQALGIPNGTEAWVLADNAVVLEKVKQALRDKGPIDAFDSSHQLMAPASNPVDYNHMMQQTQDYHGHQTVLNQMQNLNLLHLGQYTQSLQSTTSGLFHPSLYARDQLFPASACTLLRLESAWIAIAVGMTTPSMSASSFSQNGSIPLHVPPTLLGQSDHGPALFHHPNACNGSLISNVHRVALPGPSAAKRNHTTAPLEGNLSKKRKV
jgi:hypothetical protein